jgi:hypothetical protein
LLGRLPLTFPGDHQSREGERKACSLPSSYVVRSGETTTPRRTKSCPRPPIVLPCSSAPTTARPRSSSSCTPSPPASPPASPGTQRGDRNAPPDQLPPNPGPRGLSA